MLYMYMYMYVHVYVHVHTCNVCTLHVVEKRTFTYNQYILTSAQ